MCRCCYGASLITLKPKPGNQSIDVMPLANFSAQHGPQSSIRFQVVSRQLKRSCRLSEDINALLLLSTTDVWNIFDTLLSVRRSAYGSGCLKGSTEFFCNILSQKPQNGPAYEGFLMQAMIFLNDTQLSKAYKEGSDGLIGSAADSDQACILTRSLWLFEIAATSSMDVHAS